MVKRRCNIRLSTDVIVFIERNRGSFSFSAYTEYLLREPMRSMRKREPRGKDEVDAEARRYKSPFFTTSFHLTGLLRDP